MSGVIAELLEESVLVQNLEASQGDVFDYASRANRLQYTLHYLMEWHYLNAHARINRITGGGGKTLILGEQNELIDFQPVFLFSWNR